MAAVSSVVGSVVTPVWSNGQDATQTIGTQGHPLSDRGIPEQLPQYGPQGGQAMPEGVNPNPFTEHMGFLGREYTGAQLDHTSTVPGDGPTVPWNTFPYAEQAHALDQGGPKAYRHNYHPDNGDPAMYDWRATNSDYSSDKTSPVGYTAEMPGQFIGHNARWVDNRNLGYTYTGYDERPFYNTLAAVAPNLDESTGPFVPDGSYTGQTTVYNDGGTPPAYVNPPDPAVGGSPQVVAEPMGWGF
jgi:hypothetical protein